MTIANKATQALTLALALSLLEGTVLVAPQANAQQRSNSRLSQLIQKKPTLYLPARLFVGQENRFVLKAKPGQKVLLLVSPESSGFKSPSGDILRVGQTCERIEGVVPENGVLVLNLPVPDEEELVGRDVYLEALTWSAEDQSDVQIMDQLGNDGRNAMENRVVLARMESGKGTSFMPAMPGMQADLLQRITTFSDLQGGDARKKELIDDGNVDKSVLMDRNNFINRPNTMGGGP